MAAHVPSDFEPEPEPKSYSGRGDGWDRRMKFWAPPPWWNFDGEVKNPEDLEKIRAAYAKADNCAHCADLHGSKSNMSFKPQSSVLSAENGCAGCLLLLSILRICGSIQYSTYWYGFEGDPLTFRTTVSKMIMMDTEKSSFEVYALPGLTTRNHHWRIPMLPEDWKSSHYTGSDLSLRCAQTWLQECKHKHASCKNTGSILPTRVVRIAGPRNVRLYQSSGEIEKYVCLSHCWGKVKIIQTTRSTVNQYKEGIPWEDLSLTFQEAISFAFRLGYRYIWIDSLCIVQDDGEDWRHEGSRMSQIYAGADLTIAATASSDGSGGCFRRNDRPALEEFSYPAADGSEMRLGIRLSVENENWHNAKLPLLGRAWVLQERLLSHRVLHFLEEELLWECRNDINFELFMQGHRVRKLDNRFDTSYFARTLSLDKKNMAHRWREIIHQYSRQELTNEEDIFPALQGISKQISEHIRSRYLAGLWEIDIIHGLLWYSGLEPMRRMRPKGDRIAFVIWYTRRFFNLARQGWIDWMSGTSKAKARPQKWRAPSWSWASTLGPITWHTILEPYEFKPYASYISAQLEPLDLDEFGALKSGKITLRGQCFKEVDEGVFCIHPNEYTGNVAYTNRSDWMSWTVRFAQDCVSFDGMQPYSEPLTPGQRAKTLLMGETNMSRIYQFLVLRPVPGIVATYQRFAYMELKNYEIEISELFDALGEEEIIHII